MESVKTNTGEKPKMAARAIPVSSAQSVSDVINEIREVLDMKETMLAAVLRVTERTIPNWKNTKSLEGVTGKGRRLIALHYVVVKAQASGIPNNEILNLLDEPFQPENEDSGCLLSLITGDHIEPTTFNPLAIKQIEDFKRRNL